MKTALFDLETVIITRRTVVRRLREQEGTALFELVRANTGLLEDLHPAVLPVFEDASAAEIFVRQRLAAWLLQEAFHFIIWDKERAQMIGYAAFDPVQWELPKARLNGFIDKQYQAAGLMGEVFAVLLPFGFQQLGLEKITLTTGTDNIAAQRLARRFGFVREGDLRGEYLKKSGESVDVLRFGLNKKNMPA
ncbi:MAG: GNAT family N-acetyltransferase [Saprospiraceae bacterium]